MRLLNDSDSAVRKLVRGLGGAGRRLDGRIERIGVAADDAVGEVDDARGVLLGELGVVRHHHDQAVLGDLGEQVHHLHARLGIERAGGLVGEQDLGIVDEGARDGHTLHLAAGQLAGLLVGMLAQPHLLERCQRAFMALGTRHARKRQRQLHVGEDRLMRDEVVALEHEADAVVAIGVPVAILVLARGDAVDDQVARIVVVQAADDVEERGLARARRAQDCDELAVSESDGHMVEGRLRERARGVRLADIAQFQHGVPFGLRLCGSRRHRRMREMTHHLLCSKPLPTGQP